MLAFPLADLKALCENYIDLRMQSIQMKEDTTSTTDMLRDPVLVNTASSLDYKLVPVALPNNTGTVYAKVSPEDFDMVNKPEYKWRRTVTGFAVFVKRHGDDFVSTYMHVMIHGSHAKHVNGDRLDNRRTNLITGRSPPISKHKKRERESDHEEGEDSEFVLHTPRVVAADMYKFKFDDKGLETYTGFGEIAYKEGKKLYSGEIVRGKPHGYGHLYETETSTQSCGNWLNGRMMEGMVLTFKDLPDCFVRGCEGLKQCPHREVKRLDVVKHGYRQ